eukprot:CAMPEP_0197577276 /NCGR_PEP_ID=MMETSP1326-20131121/1967_1 /TAXON_ID=1155430 /ORGANISM="Genus nov. species nov., Strain RCC2288" /LENGTH=89 /DNA_ID=CAMNT_0043140327 /DNA_START=47 /DNA_END=313 /DNA_ORIENTATION=+
MASAACFNALARPTPIPRRHATSASAAAEAGAGGRVGRNRIGVSKKTRGQVNLSSSIRPFGRRGAVPPPLRAAAASDDHLPSSSSSSSS